MRTERKMDEIMRRELIEWLSNSNLRYTTNGNKTSIFVLFHGGTYVRVTDFNSKTGKFYVKDDGIIKWMSPFELTDLLRNYGKVDEAIDKYVDFVTNYENKKEN